MINDKESPARKEVEEVEEEEEEDTEELEKQLTKNYTELKKEEIKRKRPTFRILDFTKRENVFIFFILLKNFIFLKIGSILGYL